MLIEPVEIDFDRGDRAALPEAHDRALAELLFDLADGDVDSFGAFFHVFERHAVSLALAVCEIRMH